MRRNLPSKALPLLAALALLVTLGVAGRAEAQSLLGTGGTTGLTGTGGTTGAGGGFQSSDFFIGVQAQEGINLSTFDGARFFNLARCNCATPAFIFLALQGAGFTDRQTITTNTGTISVFIGNGCDNITYTPSTAYCKQLATESLLTFANQAQWTIPTDAQTLSTSFGTAGVLDGGTSTTGASAACTSPTGEQFFQTIWVDISYDGSPTEEIDVNASLQVTIDLSPPPPPTNVTVKGGDEALVFNWTDVDESITTDLLGYQILCSRADQYQVFKDTPNDAGGSNGPFSASFVNCPATQTGTGVEGSDPTFACSPLISADSSNYRVEILQNEITYAAAVLAIDQSGNASPPVPIVYGTPVPTLSFYDVYRSPYMASTNGTTSDPGGASGGFCALAMTRPRTASTVAALVLFGLGAGGLALARRRRRGRR